MSSSLIQMLRPGFHGNRRNRAVNGKDPSRVLPALRIEMLENRRLLSVSSTILSSLDTVAGNIWTYQSNAGGTTTTYTDTSDGPTTVNGQTVYPVDTTGAYTTSTNFGLSSAGLIGYSTHSTQTSQGLIYDDTTTYLPYKISFPAVLNVGQPVTSTWTNSVVQAVTGYPTTSTTSADSDTLTLASDTQQLITVPAGTFNAFQINETYTITPTDGSPPTTATDVFFIAPGTGAIEYVTGSLANPTSTDVLTGFTPAPGTGNGKGPTPVAPALTGSLPTSIIAGSKTKISQTLTITNPASAPFSGSATTELFLSTDSTVDADSIALPGSTSKSLTLQAGKKFSEKLSLASLPTSIPSGTYHLVAQVTDAIGDTTTGASAGTVTIAPPQIDLGVAYKKFVATGKLGKPYTETLTISNSGNIAAAGPLSIVIDASPDGNLSDGVQVASLPKTINIKPGKSITVPVKVTASSAGTAFLIAQIDPANTFADVNLANNLVVSPAVVVIS